MIGGHPGSFVLDARLGHEGPGVLYRARGPRPGRTVSEDAGNQTSVRRGRRLWGGIVLLVIVLGGVGYGWLGHHAARKPLPAHSRILLADFADSTPGRAFGGALRQALEAQLAQTPFLQLVSDQEIAADVDRMGLPSGARIRGAAALQLCLHTGSAAVLEGSIAPSGSGYRLVLQALGCSSGNAMASAQETTAGQSQIPQALGRLATLVRGQLGESLASLSQFDTPLVDVTSSSLPALQAYSQGVRQLRQGDSAAARSLFTNALQSDPNFVMAYALRGTAERDSGPGGGQQDFIQAYQRRNRVSQSERFDITSLYDDDVRGDIPQAESDYRAWAATYPSNPVPRVALCHLELSVGQFQAALADSATAVRLSNNAASRANLPLAQVYSGRLPEAHRLLQQTLRLYPNDTLAHSQAQWLAYIEHDAASMQTQTQWLQQHGDARSSQGLRTRDALKQGRLHALQDAMGAGLNAGDLVVLAAADAVMGSHANARREVEKALRLSSAPGLLGPAAMVLTMAGSPSRGESLDTKLEQLAGTRTTVQSMALPVNRAWVALARQQPRAALTLLDPAVAYEHATTYGPVIAYTHGMVLLALKQYVQAEAEFEVVLATPPPVNLGLYAALAIPSRLELARTQALLGQTPAARANYAKVLDAWKQADRLPLVLAAWRESERLH